MSQTEESERTIFIRHRYRDNTKPCMEIFHLIPQQKLKILIGRIYHGEDEDCNPAYILQNWKGEECFARTNSMQEIKYLFSSNGFWMAERAIAQTKHYEKETATNEKEFAPNEELNNLRSKKRKDNDQSIER